VGALTEQKGEVRRWCGLDRNNPGGIHRAEMMYLNPIRTSAPENGLKSLATVRRRSEKTNKLSYMRRDRPTGSLPGKGHESCIG